MVMPKSYKEICAEFDAFLVSVNVGLINKIKNIYNHGYDNGFNDGYKAGRENTESMYRFKDDTGL